MSAYISLHTYIVAIKTKMYSVRDLAEYVGDDCIIQIEKEICNSLYNEDDPLVLGSPSYHHSVMYMIDRDPKRLENIIPNTSEDNLLYLKFIKDLVGDINKPIKTNNNIEYFLYNEEGDIISREFKELDSIAKEYTEEKETFNLGGLKCTKCILGDEMYIKEDRLRINKIAKKNKLGIYLSLESYVLEKCLSI